MNNRSILDENRIRAEAHTREMEQSNGWLISASIASSILYGGPAGSPGSGNPRCEPHWFLMNADSVSAIMTSRSRNKAVLNFASYVDPGGGFSSGYMAQEESLCHASFLYNVLREMPEYYEWNRRNTRGGLYENRAIYTPEVAFGETSCDVITCAAPNAGAAGGHGNVSAVDNILTLDSRLSFVRDIAEENGVETLILGAYGCGAAGQDPENVCNAIFAAFRRTSISNILIAVPGDGRNYRAFSREFERYRAWLPCFGKNGGRRYEGNANVS